MLSCAPPRVALVAVAALAAAALAACEPLPREVFRCEEAMARVLECCPGVAESPVACEYAEGPLAPDVKVFPAVDCLVGKSCTALREGGACAWAVAGGEGEVCP